MLSVVGVKMNGVNFQALLGFFWVAFSFPSFALLLLLSVEVVEVPPSAAIVCKPYTTPDKMSSPSWVVPSWCSFKNLLVDFPGFVTKMQQPAFKLQL